MKKFIILFIVLIVIVFFIVNIIKLTSVPKQEINNGDTWVFSSCYYEAEDELYKISVKLMTSMEYTILVGYEYGTQTYKDYIKCENGVVKYCHYVGKDATDGSVNMQTVYRDFDIEITEIGTYDGKKIKLNHDEFTNAYASENVMYVTWIYGEKEIILGFKLKSD